MDTGAIVAIAFVGAFYLGICWLILSNLWFDRVRHRRALRRVVEKRGGNIASEKPFAADIRLSLGLVRATFTYKQFGNQFRKTPQARFRAWYAGGTERGPKFAILPKGRLYSGDDPGTGDRLFDYDFIVYAEDMDEALEALTPRARKILMELGSLFRLRESIWPLRDVQVVSDGESVVLRRWAGAYKREKSVELVVDFIDELTRPRKAGAEVASRGAARYGEGDGGASGGR